MTYADKLKDPRWQKKRLEIMERDGFRCRDCGDDESTLNVDHKVYRSGADPWDYPNDDLQTLCEDCHDRISKMRKSIMDTVGRMNSWELGRVLTFIKQIPICDEVLIMFGDEGPGVMVSLDQWDRALNKLNTPSRCPGGKNGAPDFSCVCGDGDHLTEK